jgi:probable rRNA maturation factor
MKLFLDNEDLAGGYAQLDEPFFLSIVSVIATFVEVNTQDAELSLVLTDDENIMALNLQHRNKPEATDVLSFPMDDELILGDIVISLDTAAAQAKDAEIPLELEVAFLFIHGFLHLIGYDHETSAEDEEEMFTLQEDILRAWAQAR